MEPGPEKINWKALFQNGHLETIQNPMTGDIYTLSKFLGQGGFGTVFKATSQQLNKDFALKLMELQNAQNEADFLEEKTAYLDLSRAPTCHMYIVCMFDAFIFDYDGHRVGAIVTEFMDGDLLKLMPTDDEIPSLMKALIDGLSYIHANEFAHRDLKPENILRKGKLFKISDLGLICDIHRENIPSCSHAGTPIYSSPITVKTWGQEVSLEDEQKEDIWSLGMTLYVLIFGNFPAEIRSDRDVANLTQAKVNQFLNRNTPYPRSPPATISGRSIIFLLSRMLKVNPNERWTIDQIRNYFNSHLRTPMQPAPAKAPVQRRPYQVQHPDLAQLLGRYPNLAYLIHPYGQYGPYGAPFRAGAVQVDGNRFDGTASNSMEPKDETSMEEEVEEKHEPSARELDTAELCRIMAQAVEYYQTDPEFAEELIDIVDAYINEHELDFDYLQDCWETMADGLEIQQRQGTCGIRQQQMHDMLEHLNELGPR